MNAQNSSGESSPKVEKQKPARQPRGTDRFAHIKAEWFAVKQYLSPLEWSLLSEMIRHIPTIKIYDVEFAARCGVTPRAIITARQELQRLGIYKLLAKGTGGWKKVANTATLPDIVGMPGLLAEIITKAQARAAAKDFARAATKAAKPPKARKAVTTSSEVGFTSSVTPSSAATSVYARQACTDARPGQSSSEVWRISSSEVGFTLKDRSIKGENNGAALYPPVALRSTVGGAPPGVAVAPLPPIAVGCDSQAMPIGFDELELFSIFPALMSELEDTDDETGDDWTLESMTTEDMETITAMSITTVGAQIDAETPKAAESTNAPSTPHNGTDEPDVATWNTRHFARFYWSKVKAYHASGGVGEDAGRPDWGALCGQIDGMLRQMPKQQLHAFIRCLTEQFDVVASRLSRFDLALNDTTLSHPTVASTVNAMLREDRRAA